MSTESKDQNRRSEGTRRRPNSWPGRVAALTVAFALPAFVAARGGLQDAVGFETLCAATWAVIFLLGLGGFIPAVRSVPGRGLLIASAGALLAWMILSLLWTDSFERTAAEIVRDLGYAGVVVVVLLFVSSRSWRWATAGLLIAGVGICLAAMTARLIPDAVGFGTGALLDQRLRFPLDYWNALGSIAASTALLAVGVAISTRERLTCGLASAVVPLAIGVTYLTYSRGAILALAGGLVALVVLVPLGRRFLRVAAVSVPASALVIVAIRSQPEIATGSGDGGAPLVLAALLVAMASCGYVGSRRSRSRGSSSLSRGLAWPAALVLVAGAIWVIGQSDDAVSALERSLPAGGDPAERLLSAETERADLYGSAVAAFASSPITGIGAGTFTLWWDGDGGRAQILDAHSLYLESLAELGIGALALFGVLAGLLRSALLARGRLESRHDRAVQAGLIAAFCGFLLQAGFDWLWEEPAVGIVGLGAIAIAIAAGSHPRPRSLRMTRSRVGLLVAALAAIVITAPVLVAADRSQRSAVATTFGQTELALKLADDAIEANPYAATPRARRAEALLQAGLNADARVSAEEAVDREPSNWRWRALEARIELVAGDRAASVARLDEVIELRPAAAGLIEALKPGVLRGDPDALLLITSTS